MVVTQRVVLFFLETGLRFGTERPSWFFLIFYKNIVGEPKACLKRFLKKNTFKSLDKFLLMAFYKFFLFFACFLFSKCFRKTNLNLIIKK